MSDVTANTPAGSISGSPTPAGGSSGAFGLPLLPGDTKANAGGPANVARGTPGANPNDFSGRTHFLDEDELLPGDEHASLAPSGMEGPE